MPKKGVDSPDHMSVPPKASYSVAPKGSERAKSGVFKTLPLPRGREMKMLDREVFEGAVRAAMKAKRRA